MENKLFVTYEEFGALGDGKTCDIEAPRHTHTQTSTVCP